MKPASVVAALLFVWGCAARSAVPSAEPVGMAAVDLPVCAEATVAVGAGLAQRAPSFMAEAGYPAARLVDEPDPRPQLLNMADVERALIATYPVALRNRGIGGEAVVLLLIDPAGVVIHRAILESAGNATLDAGALTVVDAMRFSPATTDGCRTGYLAQIPIRYRTMNR